MTDVNEADELLREIGLDPTCFRTESGWLNFGKINAALKNPKDYSGLYISENACKRCGAEEWELISTKGGAMDRCKGCGNSRWHKPAAPTEQTL